MIEDIPGWLNFIGLAAFYYGLIALLEVVSGLKICSPMQVILSEFFAGAYLAKWRQNQGGGWSFNGFFKRKKNEEKDEKEIL